MIIALANQAGQVGKSVLATLLYATSENQYVLATVGKQGYGIHSEDIPQANFEPSDCADLYVSMLIEIGLIVDIGSNSFHEFVMEASRYAGLISRVERWVIPTHVHARFNHADVLETITSIQNQGASLRSVRLVLNFSNLEDMDRVEHEKEMLQRIHPGIAITTVPDSKFLRQRPLKILQDISMPSPEGDTDYKGMIEFAHKQAASLWEFILS